MCLGVRRWLVAALLVASCMSNVGQAFEDEAPLEALAIHMGMKLPGAALLASDMVVLPGRPAEMVHPGPDGRMFRLNVAAHLALAPSGAVAAQLKATLFERAGDGWRELAAPELVAPLEEPASYVVQYPAGHPSGLEALQIDARRISGVTRKASLPGAGGGKVAAAALPVQCIPCGDLQLCCTNACCKADCGSVCDSPRL